MRLEDALLYLVVREEDMLNRDVGALCRQAIAGGVDIIQVPPRAQGRELTDELRQVLAACRDDDALLVVQDDAELAMSLGADGVHLRSPDSEFGMARAIVGMERLVGLSSGTLDEARLAQEVGADYLLYLAADGAPLAGLRELAGTPVYAGGIASPGDAAGRVDVGLLRICVDSGSLGAGDVTGNAAEYSRALGRWM